MDARAVGDVLNRVVELVQTMWDDGFERGPSGDRDGQYQLDVAVDEAIVPLLLEAGFAVLSEESGLQAGQRDVLVVVDPIDGSTNADRAIPMAACSLCAIDSDGPWVAVVRDLVRRTTYRAERGHGAFRDHERLSVRHGATVSDAIVGINGWSPVPPPGAQFRTFGCASVELCLVADGALDAYVNLDLNGHGPWDYLGGALIVTEAGGVVGELTGRDLSDIGHGVRRAVVAGANADICRSVIDAYAPVVGGGQ